MPGNSSAKYKTVTVPHRMRSDTLEMREDLKEEMVKTFITLHYSEVDFSQSVDHIQTMKNHLWKKYKEKFEYKLI